MSRCVDMAILIVEHNGAVEGASLNGRVLIGRRPSNHVVVADPAVSRIHAWIDTAAQQFCLTDAGSRTGTFVNGHRVAGKVPLRHGDRIGVGPAALTFRTDASLPAGVSQLDFGRPRPGAGGVSDGGVMLDCTCGAPLWASADFAGRSGTCRFCGATVVVPGGANGIANGISTPATTAAAVAPSSRRAGAVVAAGSTTAASCGACQSVIAPAEDLATCPACGLTFHADCWAENYGCSAYGCSQVNALLPATKPDLIDAEKQGPTGGVDAPASGELQEGVAPAAEKVPGAYVLLGVSVVGLLAGAFTFGVPSLLAAVAALVYLKRQRGAPHRGVAWAATSLALAGIVAGAAVSYVWWLGEWSALR